MILSDAEGTKSVELHCKTCHQAFIRPLAFNEQNVEDVTNILKDKTPREYKCPHACDGKVTVHVRPKQIRKELGMEG